LVFAPQVKQEWLDLKNGWPKYIDEMDHMFAVVAVTGESTFVPGASRHLNFISSGDEDEAPADFGTPQSRGTPQNFSTPHSHGTPVSSGSKRTTSSTRSTATSPSKKPKNAAVRNMNNNMTRFNSSYDKRIEVIENIRMEKMYVEQEISIKQQQLSLQQQQ
jgi:hypothetical protein